MEVNIPEETIYYEDYHSLPAYIEFFSGDDYWNI